MVTRLSKGARFRKTPLGLLSLRAIRSRVPLREHVMLQRGALPLPHPAPHAPKIYGQISDLQVRLAQSHADVRRAQRLRYRVFYEELSATPTFKTKMRRLDEDHFDQICDHLLVVDTTLNDQDRVQGTGRIPDGVVGTYRVLRQDVAEGTHGFYTQREYDIAPLVAARSPGYRFMELGRSCVLKPYRNKRTVELLWHGLWTYVREHRIDVMIGCASFEGIDPDAHSTALSFLHHHRLAPAEWRCRAHADQYVPMNRIPRDRIDTKMALKALPPLIKGYLRLGAYIGDGAVVDRQFGTTDVLIILPVEKIDPRYFDHFGGPDELRCRVGLEN